MVGFFKFLFLYLNYLLPLHQEVGVSWIGEQLYGTIGVNGNGSGLSLIPILGSLSKVSRLGEVYLPWFVLWEGDSG